MYFHLDFDWVTSASEVLVTDECDVMRGLPLKTPRLCSQGDCSWTLQSVNTIHSCAFNSQQDRDYLCGAHMFTAQPEMVHTSDNIWHVDLLNHIFDGEWPGISQKMISTRSVFVKKKKELYLHLNMKWHVHNYRHLYCHLLQQSNISHNCRSTSCISPLVIMSIHLLNNELLEDPCVLSSQKETCWFKKNQHVSCW